MFRHSTLSNGLARRVPAFVMATSLTLFLTSSTFGQCAAGRGGGGRVAPGGGGTAAGGLTAQGGLVGGGGVTTGVGGAAAPSFAQIQQMMQLQQLAALAQGQSLAQQRQRAAMRARQPAPSRQRRPAAARVSTKETSNTVSPTEARAAERRRRTLAYRAWKERGEQPASVASPRTDSLTGT